MQAASVSLGSLHSRAVTYPPVRRSLLQYTLICSLLPAFATTTAAGQTPPGYLLQHWTTSDGLPSNNLSRVTRGAGGYIWVATKKGLARFDGVRFVTFDQANSRGLPDDSIENVHGARDSTIWIMTTDWQVARLRHGAFKAYGVRDGLPRGLSYLFRYQGEIRLSGRGRSFRYVNGEVVPVRGQPADVSARFYRDPEGVSWFASLEHGLIRLKDGRYRSFTMEDGLQSNRVESIQESAWDNGTLWFLAGHVLHRLDDERVEAIALPMDVEYFHREPSGRWWFATTDGLYRSQGSYPTPLSRIDDVGAGIWDPQRDADGHLWISSRRNLYRDGEVVFSHSDIRHFRIDATGSAWIATTDDGLYRLRPVPFRVIGPPEGISYRVVLPVLEDRNGATWAGTQLGGLNKLEADSVVLAGVPGVPSQHVFALHEDRDGVLWVGTDNGICRVAGTVCKDDLALNFGATTRAIWQDLDGVYWFGTESGLYRYHNQTLERLTTADGLSSDWVQGIVPRRDGGLWLATHGGGVMAYRDQTFSALTTAKGLATDAVQAIYQDADGVLWVGGEGGGLTRIKLAQQGQGDGDAFAGADVRVLREEDGLFDSWLHRILEDDTGRLWMTSNRGVFWIWKSELDAWARGGQATVHSVVYGEVDGLRSPAGAGRVQPAGVKGIDGRLRLPTENGLAIVDPAKLDRFDTTPTPLIERMEVWGETQPIYTGDVMLEATQRVLTLDYTAFAWPDAGRTQFQYQLEGHDDGWIDAGRRRQVVYGGLGPGHYKFRLKAMNHAGVWGANEASLSISVAPFYYEQWWFWMLGGIGVLGLFGGVYRWRLQSHIRRERRLEVEVAERTAEVARQAEELRALDKAKNRFFANISHEFRTPLTLSMGPLEDVRIDRYGPIPPEAKQRIDLALLNNRRLLRLVNQLLDVARLEAHTLTLHVRALDLPGLLGRLKLAFSPLAERKRIAFTHRLVAPDNPVYADPDQLEKVFTNLLSNAFKFTPEEGRIEVAIDSNPAEVPCAEAAGRDWIVVHVRDTGPGIPAYQIDQVFDRFYQTETGSNHADAGTGIGLALVRELVTLHGGCVDVESSVGSGTTFSVYLRTGMSHLEHRDDVEIDPTPLLAESSVLPVDTHADDHDLLQTSAPVATNGTSKEVEDSTDDEDRLTILIVDDNAEVRAFVREHLEEVYRTVEAVDGRDGLAQARALTPDLIVSDVMMPEMDGFGLCRAVKQDPELGFVPVILLTAKAGVENKLEGLEGGADDYLTKPFNMTELKTRIANLITLRRRLREQFLAAAGPAIPPLDVMSTDDVFREGVRTAVEANFADENFDVVALAEAVAMDRSHLYRRMKETLDKSPSAYIREARLERAAGLLRAGAGTVSEIAYGVGFRSLSHFAAVFRKQYGCSPTQYAG